MNREAETLTRALEAFRQETGLKMEVREREAKVDHTVVDAILELRDPPRTKYFAEIKNWVQQVHPGTLLNQLMQIPEPKLLIADYVNRKLALRFKERGIQFIDTAGNAYLNQLPNFYINVRGNEREATLTTHEFLHPHGTADGEENKKAPIQNARGRAFTPTGLKVVYAFLIEPDLIHATYREIAKKADVALGTVGWVITDLKTRDLVFEKGKQKKIGDYRTLLELWTEAYLINLRPKLLLAELFHEDPYWWREFDIRQFNGQWGGETAGAKLTNNLKPVTTTIYLRGELTPLVQQARLHKRQNVTDAKVEILRPFWPKEMDNNQDVVDQLLVYADLIDTADPRNVETAQLLLDRYFDQYIPLL